MSGTTSSPNPAYGYVFGSAIAKGRIASIDLSEAKAAPGRPGASSPQKTPASSAKATSIPPSCSAVLTSSTIIRRSRFVVAETFEQARAAAQLVRVDYAPDRRRLRSRGGEGLAAAKPEPGFGGPADTAVGDFAGAFAAAPVQLDATYTTPDQSHAMMEPHASIAAWDGDKLTLWTSNQMIDWGTGDLAKTLGIAKENVRLISPYIGGGFGGKAVPAVRRACSRRWARAPPAGR